MSTETADTPIALPSGAEFTALLRLLGAAPADVEELPALLDAVLASPDLRERAQRFCTALRAEIGALRPGIDSDFRANWPPLPLTSGTAARCVYLPGFLATVDDVRELHRRRGIPEERSAATLADFGRQLARHRSSWGAVGIDTQWWLALVWTGVLVDLGRLQGEWRDPQTVGLHIPASGPLTPASVDASLALLRSEWATWFGAEPAVAECLSWLLDPTLADYLPPESNIVAFQRRFTPVAGDITINDADPLYFVFHRRGVVLPDELDDLPRDTVLQRAVIDHLRSGGHWTVRRGFLEL